MEFEDLAWEKNVNISLIIIYTYYIVKIMLILEYWVKLYYSINLSCFFLLFNLATAAAAAKSHQLCPTLCDPTDGSPPGSSVPGIFQARILEWVAIFGN